MRKLLICITILCALSTFAYAQTQTTSFDVDGIKVIFRPTVKDVINVRMFYRGGVNNYPADKAGIERFSLTSAIECGTQKYSANAFRDNADKYGITLRIAAEPDYGDIEMECVSKYFNDGWSLFSEAVVNPVFKDDEVELLKNKIISSIRQRQSNPDTRVTQLVMKNAFEGTPYATDPYGDDEAIRKMNSGDLKAYYASVLNKNQIFIVVAGKISQEELTAKIKAAFSGLPAREYRPASYTEPEWTDYKVLKENRELSTNYIKAIMNAPAVNSPDFTAYRMGVAVLGGTLFAVLRTQLNLSYNPGATSVAGKMSYGTMYISTTRVKEAIPAMTAQIVRLKKNEISELGLQHLKSGFITNYYITQQSTSSITGNLGQAEVFGGWEMEDALTGLVNKVTPGQIKDALNKYIIGLRWSYLGNEDQYNDAGNAFSTKMK